MRSYTNHRLFWSGAMGWVFDVDFDATDYNSHLQLNCGDTEQHHAELAPNWNSCPTGVRSRSGWSTCLGSRFNSSMLIPPGSVVCRSLCSASTTGTCSQPAAETRAFQLKST